MSANQNAKQGGKGAPAPRLRAIRVDAPVPTILDRAMVIIMTG